MLKKILPIAAMVATTAFADAPKAYNGAEVFTKETFQYGKFEARMYMGAASGTVSSMFLYYNDSYIATNPWVEVDIEILGKNPSSFQSNIITGNANAKVTSEAHHGITPAANTTYHTYGMEWTPNYVSWQIDGVEVRRTTTGSTDYKNQVQNLVKEQDLRFNLWSSEDAGWVGQWNDSNLPVYQYINWVKVYEYKPGQGDNGTDFKLKWVDDFNSFDSNRWGTGDWTFETNRVDLSPQNVVVKDGALVLCLTKSSAKGFYGTVPADNEPSSSSSIASSSSSEIPGHAGNDGKSSSSSVIESSSSTLNSSSSWTPTISSSSTPNSSSSSAPNSSSSSAPTEDLSSSSMNANDPAGIAREKGVRVKESNKPSYNAKGEKLGKRNTPRGGFFKRFVK